MIDELGRHGYRLSAGTLYPILTAWKSKATSVPPERSTVAESPGVSSDAPGRKALVTGPAARAGCRRKSSTNDGRRRGSDDSIVRVDSRITPSTTSSTSTASRASSRSRIQNTSLLKLTFHVRDRYGRSACADDRLRQSRACVHAAWHGRPFIKCASTPGRSPVGYLVFSSDSRSLGEIQDLALNRVRPQFATLPGLTSPPPFGGSQRTIVIRVDPDRLVPTACHPEESDPGGLVRAT